MTEYTLDEALTATQKLLIEAEELLEYMRERDHFPDATKMVERSTDISKTIEPVAVVITLEHGRNSGKQVTLLRDVPNGTELYASPIQPLKPIRTSERAPTEKDGEYIYAKFINEKYFAPCPVKVVNDHSNYYHYWFPIPEDE